MPPYKRKLMSESAWQASKRSKPASAKASSVVRMKPNQKAKMLSILKGHTQNYTATLKSGTVAVTGEAHCMTAADFPVLATSILGILGSGTDSARLNWIEFRGKFLNDNNTTAVTNGDYSPAARILVVYFNKPGAPDSIGTLPAITNVLETDELESLVIADDEQNGRFKILSDRTFKVNCDSSAYVGRTDFHYKVPVNRACDFLGQGTDTNPGGHFDTDVTSGQVNKGLLVTYVIGDWVGAAYTLQCDIRARLNFTV